jgi:ubiquinone/menaquinone biosynthesis C-methylase UbiE
MPAVAVDSSRRSGIPDLKDPSTDKKMVAPHTRTLTRDMPELKAYLKPGMLVLDVGSGMGTITLDVAAAVLPGKVVGLDPSVTRVKTAQEWQAQQDGGVENG